MAKKKVCVSFDYENDRWYYYLLKCWDSNNSFEFSFNDMTTNEINSNSVAKVKNVLSRKIGEANYMIAIFGEHSDDEHPDCEEIGYRNWQAYELAKNYEKGNGLVCVKISDKANVPCEAYGKGAKWVYSFNQAQIIAALNSFE